MILFTNHDKLARLMKNFDFYVSYIDDGAQYQDAVKRNKDIADIAEAMGCKVIYHEQKFDTTGMLSSFESIIDNTNGWITEIVETDYGYKLIGHKA